MWTDTPGMARCPVVSVREITTIGDPVLATRARELDRDELASAESQALIDDLIETRAAARGAGLAANQVGVPLRIAVVEVEADNPRYPYKPPFPLTVLVNPVLEPVGEDVAVINEGCLSVPDLRGDVPRHLAVRARYLDRDGVEHEQVVRGLTAGTFQHEVDHLNGVLFVERVTDPKTFSTWEQFDRHRRAEFERRAAQITRWAES
jgi:peptide deformylase